MSIQQQHHRTKVIKHFKLPLSGWICRRFNNPGPVSDMSLEFILPWKQGQLFNHLPQFYLFCCRLIVSESMHLPIQFSVALRAQLYLQQRDVSGSKWHTGLGWMAVQCMCSYQLLPIRSHNTMPCWILLSCIVAQSHCLSFGLILPCVGLRSHHVSCCKLLP